MQTIMKPLRNEIKRDDSVKSSRFFVFGEGVKRGRQIRKVFFLFMVFGLIGLLYGCELETIALSESDISDDYNEEVKKSLRELISTGNCKGCPLEGVDISGKDLNHKDLTGANLTGVDLDSAIKCKTIFPWGEDNSGCKQKMTQNF